MRDDNGIMYIVSGAGNTCCTEDESVAEVPSQFIEWYVSGREDTRSISGGFSSVSVSQSGLVVDFYDQRGRSLFKTAAAPARVSLVPVS
jgi:hypothetical protein